MTTEGLEAEKELLIQRIIEDAKKEAERIVKEAREKASERLEKMKKELREQIQSEVGEYIKKAEMESERIIKSAISESRIRKTSLVVEEKNKLLNEIFNEAFAELKKRVSENYEDVLKSLIVEGISTLGLSEAEILLPEDFDGNLNVRDIEEDIREQSGKNVKLTLSADRIKNTGILIRSKDGKIALDNTFEGRLQRLKRRLILKIQRMISG